MELVGICHFHSSGMRKTPGTIRESMVSVSRTQRRFLTIHLPLQFMIRIIQQLKFGISIRGFHQTEDIRLSAIQSEGKQSGLSVAGQPPNGSDAIMRDNKNNRMRTEYDFSEGVRGRHFKAYRAGPTIEITAQDGSIETHRFTQEDGSVLLDPDVKRHFPDSKSVNKALRSLIKKS